MLTRRRLMTGFGMFGFASAGVAGYAVAEPWRLTATHYAVSPPGWPVGRSLRIVALADLHVCDPFMTIERVRHLVASANALAPDVVVLLGDYLPSAGLTRFAGPVAEGAIADALAPLTAPRGVYAILGNHDWWEDADAMRRRDGETKIGRALRGAGIRVLENDAVRTGTGDAGVWIAGLGSQWAFPRRRRVDDEGRRWRIFEGRDDLKGTLAHVVDDAPVVLLIHEPDGFVDVPARVALTLAGHTHGGQIQVLGYPPVVPSRFGRRFAYGHIVEEDRHLIVSGGLGCSGVPIRLGCPPEIVVVDLGQRRRELLS